MIEFKYWRSLACLLGTIALAWVTVGCGTEAGAEGEGDGTRVLSATETKQLLYQLPYRYTFRRVPKPEGAEAVVAGRAVGPHQTVLNFGIALGHGHHAVPVPRAGTVDLYGYPRDGFVFTGDSMVRGPDGHLTSNPQLKTVAQWHEAGHMEVMMTDKLCLAATGDHCPP